MGKQGETLKQCKNKGVFMEQEVAQTKLKDIDSALTDIMSQLKKPVSEYNAVIFLASVSYDIPTLAEKLAYRFPDSKVIGTSTYGEITDKGFENNSLVVTTLSDSATKFTGLLIEDADMFPIIYKSQIEKEARDCGIKIGKTGENKTAFALTFINGLCNAEEATLALLNGVIGDSEFAIAGGSAADDLQFNATYVSYNGKTTTRGAVVLFVNTPCRFIVHKENIFHGTGKKATLTGVIPETRTITSMDDKTPLTCFSQMLGIPEDSVQNVHMDHPFGRDYGGDVFISTIANFNKDGTFDMYSRILQGTVIEMLEPSDPVAIAKKSGEEVREAVGEPGFVLQINCTLRTLMFENKNLTGPITSAWKDSYPVFCGFSSYGEQINHLNANQSLLTLAIGK